MSHSSTNFNGTLTVERGAAGAQGVFVSPEEQQERVAARNRVENTLPLPMSEQLNPNMVRTLPGRDEIRSSLSSNRKKDLSRQKNLAFSTMPKARRTGTFKLTQHAAAMERLNSRLAEVVGDIDQLSSYEQRSVRTLDLAISDIEKTNRREHIVYAPLHSPDGKQETVLKHFRDTMQRNSEMSPFDQRTEDFDRYVVADHNLANLDRFGGEVVAEIRTTRGGYVGGSDTVKEAEHILPRGMRYAIVGIQENVTYIRNDGSQGQRTVVQLEDTSINNQEEA